MYIWLVGIPSEYATREDGGVEEVLESTGMDLCAVPRSCCLNSCIISCHAFTQLFLRNYGIYCAISMTRQALRIGIKLSSAIKATWFFAVATSSVCAFSPLSAWFLSAIQYSLTMTSQSRSVIGGKLCTRRHKRSASVLPRLWTRSVHA